MHLRFQAGQATDKEEKFIQIRRKANKLGILHDQLNSGKVRITYIEHNRR